MENGLSSKISGEQFEINDRGELEVYAQYERGRDPYSCRCNDSCWHEIELTLSPEKVGILVQKWLAWKLGS